MTNRRTSTLVWPAIVLVISVAAIAVIGTLAFSGDEVGHGMMGAGVWGWGMAFMALPAIIIILILLVAIGGLDEKPPYNTYPVYVPPQPSPIDILNQRYAQGDVSHEEYERIRAKLGKG